MTLGVITKRTNIKQTIISILINSIIMLIAIGIACIVGHGRTLMFIATALAVVASTRRRKTWKVYVEQLWELVRDETYKKQQIISLYNCVFGLSYLVVALEFVVIITDIMMLTPLYNLPTWLGVLLIGIAIEAAGLLIGILIYAMYIACLRDYNKEKRGKI